MFQDGNYNFGKAEPDTVKAVHDIEDEFGAYYFVAKSDKSGCGGKICRSPSNFGADSGRYGKIICRKGGSN